MHKNVKAGRWFRAKVLSVLTERERSGVLDFTPLGPDSTGEDMMNKINQILLFLDTQSDTGE